MLSEQLLLKLTEVYTRGTMGWVSAVLMSAGNSFHHCVARTSNNQDFVERLLTSPHNEGVAVGIDVYVDNILGL